MELDQVQKAAAEQFGRQSERYAKGHILADVSDVKAALEKTSLVPPGNILDVATGAGNTGLYLASLGHRVVLADIAEAMLQRAKEAAAARGLSIEARQHPAENFPYSDATFDLVTCRVAAHHFSSPERFVKESARVLRPGGWFLLIDGSVPDNEPLAEEWIHQVEKLRDPSHHRFKTPGAWKSLCQENRLRVASCELFPFKQPDLQWYFETAATPEANRSVVLSLVRNAPIEARKVFQVGEEEGKIVWWWPRLTLVAQKE